MNIIPLIRRLREEFTALPGLRLNEKQVQRLCTVNAPTAAAALRALVSAGLLRAHDDGTYRRAESGRALMGSPRPACHAHRRH